MALKIILYNFAASSCCIQSNVHFIYSRYLQVFQNSRSHLQNTDAKIHKESCTLRTQNSGVIFEHRCAFCSMHVN